MTPRPRAPSYEQSVKQRKGNTLSAKDHIVIATHRAATGAENGTFADRVRVPQWDGALSVYFRHTGRLWVHTTSARKQAFQELYYHSVDSIAATLTCSHRLKFWDLGRHATPRELLRIQGFPDDFVAPRVSATRLLGNAVAVPCAAHACACVLDDADMATGVTHIDLCAGIGGFSCALASVCPHATCVGFSEVNTAASNNYRANFPSAPVLGDAECVEEWPACDLLTAGFPCQPFSKCNSRTRRDVHEKRDFFLIVLDAVARSGAQRIVLENVATLLTVGRNRFDEMMVGLTRLGFVIDYHVLDARDFGLPQSRRRLYIVGRRDGGTVRHLRETIPQCTPTCLRDIIDDPHQYPITVPDDGEENDKPDDALHVVGGGCVSPRL